MKALRASQVLVLGGVLLVTGCNNGGSGGGGGGGGATTALSITGVAPASGTVSGGTQLTIMGDGFVAGLTVSVGGRMCTNINVVSATEATCTTPSVGPMEVGDVDVDVEVPGGDMDTLAAGFTFLAPAFSVVSPASGSVFSSGTVAIDFQAMDFDLGDLGETHLHFTVDGTGPYEFLNGATDEVQLGGARTPDATWTSPTSIELHGLGPGNHVVDFVLASATHDDFTQAASTDTVDFLLVAPVTVTGVAPAAGIVSGGQAITVTGTSFAAGLTVFLGGEPCTNVNVVSDTEATCTTPSVGPGEVGAVDVDVELPGGDMDTLASGFVYRTPDLDVLNPTSGSSLPAGSVTFDFQTADVLVGDYGETHLHFTIDGTGPFEFLNGTTNDVHFGGGPTPDADWISPTSFELHGLGSGLHTVEFAVASAVHDDFTQAASTETVNFNLAGAVMVTAVAPSSGTVSGGDVITVTGSGFVAGLDVRLDGTPCTNVVVMSGTEARCTTPSVGPSEVGAVTVDVEVPGGDSGMLAAGYTYIAPGFQVVSPAQGSNLPNGTVGIQFQATNFLLGDYGETHLHFRFDGSGDPPYEFLNGATDEVHLNGAHTHDAHWTSPTSIEIYGLAAGNHTVDFVLASATHEEFPQGSAAVSLDFVLDPPAPGIFNAVEMISGLPIRPISMRFTGDGRLLYTEFTSGAIRVIDTTNWQLQAAPFYTFQVRNQFTEDGIKGIELHPDYANNGLIYVFLTHPSGVSRVVRVRDNSGVGTDETVILDGIPAGNAHLGGQIRFGADGMLYVTTGENDIGPPAQDVFSLLGKVLRVDPDTGGIPADNPWAGSYSYAIGFRNPFGLDVHPDTGDLWVTDNGTDHDDELNVVVRGGNYGWDGNTNSMGVLGNPCCVDPVWASNNTQIVPTEIRFASQNTAYGTPYVWNAFFTNNNTGEVRRAIPTGSDLDDVSSVTLALSGGLGGLTGITEGPDGFLYVSTRNRRIYRLEL